METKTDMN